MKILRVIVLLFVPLFCQAQEFRGGEISLVRQFNNDKLDITTDLYFKSDEEIEKPFLLMSYSTGTIDTAFLEEHLFLPNQIQLLRYQSNFTVPVLNALYQIAVLDTFNLPVLNNLTGENSDIFFLYTKIQLASILFGESNSPPIFNSFQTEVNNFDGIFTHQLLAEDPDGDELYYALGDFSEFEDYEYSLPETDEEITISENGNFVWSRPAEDGKYLLQFLVYEFFPNSNILLSTTRRIMIIDIEDDFTVSTENEEKKDYDLIIFPNPTRDRIYYTMEDIISNSINFTLTDLSGKTILQKIEQLKPNGTIEVTHLPQASTS